MHRPRAVLLGGRPLPRSRWFYWRATRTLTISLRSAPIRRRISLTLARAH